MNSLPFDFYDNLFRHFESVAWFSAARALSGPFGSLSDGHLENETVYLMVVKNGQIRKSLLLLYNASLKQGKYVYADKSTVRNVDRCQIAIEDVDEPDEDSATPSKLPEFTNKMNISLFLKSPTISKSSEKLIDSITILGYLGITVPITRQIQAVLERIVQKKTLGHVVFNHDHWFDKSDTTFLLDLLKQDQFYSAGFARGCTVSLKDLIVGWRENSHQMIGKGLYFKAKIDDQIRSEFQFCSEHDRSFIKSYYPQEIFGGNSKMFILRGPNGRAMYVRLCNEFIYQTCVIFT